MSTCRTCSSANTFEFFCVRQPLLQYPVLKEDKRKLFDDMKGTVYLRHNYCKDCGLIYTDLSDSLARKIDYLYASFYNYPSSLESGTGHSEPDSFLAEFEGLFSKAKSILEIGCYDGFILYSLKKSGKKVLGVEPSKQGREIAQKHGIDVINDFFPTVKSIAERFDIVFSRHLIEHLADPSGFVRAQLDLLDRDGLVIFETPNAEWLVTNGNDIAFHPQHRIIVTKKFAAHIGNLLKVPFVYSNYTNHRAVYILSKRPIEGRRPLLNHGRADMGFERMLKQFDGKVVKNRNVLREVLRGHINNGHEIAIWGAGSFTGSLLVDVAELSQAKYVIDSDERKFHMEFLHSNLPIVRPDALRSDPADVVFISTQYSQEVVDYLDRTGIGSKIKFLYRLFPALEAVKRRDERVLHDG